MSANNEFSPIIIINSISSISGATAAKSYEGNYSED